MLSQADCGPGLRASCAAGGAWSYRTNGDSAALFFVNAAAGCCTARQLPDQATADEYPLQPGVHGWSSRDLLLVQHLDGLDKAALSAFDARGVLVHTARFGECPERRRSLSGEHSWSPDGLHAFVKTKGTEFWLWDITRSCVEVYRLHVRAAAWSPSSSQLVCTTYAGFQLFTLPQRRMRGLAVPGECTLCAWAEHGLIILVQNSAGNGARRRCFTHLRTYQLREGRYASWSSTPVKYTAPCPHHFDAFSPDERHCLLHGSVLSHYRLLAADISTGAICELWTVAEPAYIQRSVHCSVDGSRVLLEVMPTYGPVDKDTASRQVLLDFS